MKKNRVPGKPRSKKPLPARQTGWEQLIRQMQQQEKALFSEEVQHIFERYRGYLFRIAGRKGIPPDILHSYWLFRTVTSESCSRF